MADNTSNVSLGQFLDGIDKFVTNKTVVGDPIKTDDAVIIPLIDVSCGMAMGSFNNQKGSGAGGMFTKMSPTALLIVQNGGTKLINVKNNDAIGRLVDMLPDFVNKVTGKNQVSPKTQARAEKMAEDMKTVINEE